MKKVFSMFVLFLMLSINVSAIYDENAEFENWEDEDVAFMAYGLEEDEVAIFSDVTAPNSDFRKTEIEWMYRNGVVSGYEDGTFKPHACVNRVEFLKMLFKILNFNENAYEAELFSDTKEGEWYVPFVKTARALGVVQGYGDGTFRPGQCVSRAEAFKMGLSMYYTQDVISPNDSYFKTWSNDLNESEWYYMYAGFVLENYLFNYFGSGQDEMATSPMSRSDVAEFLYRLKSVNDRGLKRYNYMAPFDIGKPLFFEGCRYNFKSSSDDSSYLSVLPEDLSLLMSLNYSDSLNKKYFETMLGKFPDSGLLNLFMDSFTLNYRDENNFWKLSDSLFDDFELVLGIKFPEDELDIWGNDFDVFISSRVSDGNKFYDILKKTLALSLEGDMTCEVDGDFLYWTSEINEYYMVRYGDLFFITNTLKARDEAVLRVKQNLVNKNERDINDNLAFINVDGSFFADLFSLFYGELDEFGFADFYSAVKNLRFSMIAKSNSVLEFNTSIDFTDSKFLDDYRNKSLSLVNKMPGSDLIYYVEDQNLRSSFGTFISESLMDEFYLEFYDMTGLEEEEADFVINNTFAISVNAGENFFPNIALAIQFEDKDLSSAEKVLNEISLAVEENLKEMIDGTLSVDMNEYLDKSILDNGNMNRIRLDMSKLPEKFWTEEYLTEKREYLGDFVFDFWYGIKKESGMNLLVVALYPEFNSEFGVNTVSMNSDYKRAIDSLGASIGPVVSFVDISKTANALMKYFTYSGEGFYGQEFAKDFDSWVSPLDYFVSSSMLKGTGELVTKGVLKLK